MPISRKWLTWTYDREDTLSYVCAFIIGRKLVTEVETTRDTWRCLVDADGAVEELEDRSGADYIGHFDQVKLFARGFLRSSRDGITFHYVDQDDRLYRIIMRRELAARDRTFASIEMELVSSPFGMTLRELDILSLVAAGFSNDNIAARLSISMRTVAKHVENIFGKTQLFSRTVLASYAVDQGLCRLPTPGGCDGHNLSVGEIEQLSIGLSTVAPTRPRSTSKPPTKIRPLTVGVPYVSEGRGAADSVEMLNGTILAVEEINERGGIYGRPIVLQPIAFNSGDNVSVQSAYSQLIEGEVDAISAGYACYSSAIHDVVGDAGMPYLHAATMHAAVDRVRDSGSRLGNIFQTCASDVNYGRGLVRFVREVQSTGNWSSQSKRLAVVQPAWPGLNIGINRVAGELSRSGWIVDVVDVADLSGDRWAQTVDKLHMLAPSIIVVSSFFVEDAIAFQRAFCRSPLRAIVYNIYAPSVPQYREELGALSEGVIWATTSGLYADTIGSRFKEKYLACFRKAPGSSQAGLAYDRVNLLAGAWMRTGHPRIFRDVLSELRTSISRGVNGSYSLGNDGQVGLAYPDDTRDLSISQAHLVFQIQGGRDVAIGPKPFTQCKMEVPWWCALSN